MGKAGFVGLNFMSHLPSAKKNKAFEANCDDEIDIAVYAPE